MIYVWPPSLGGGGSADSFKLDGSNSSLVAGNSDVTVDFDRGVYLDVNGDILTPESSLAYLTLMKNVLGGAVESLSALGEIRFAGQTAGATSYPSPLGGSLGLGATIKVVRNGSALSGDTLPSTFGIHMGDPLSSPSLSVESSGKITLGLGSNTHRINSNTSAPAANVIAITNAPFAGAGTPSAYLRINVNGTEYVIPLLPGA